MWLYKLEHSLKEIFVRCHIKYLLRTAKITSNSHTTFTLIFLWLAALRHTTTIPPVWAPVLCPVFAARHGEHPGLVLLTPSTHAQWQFLCVLIGTIRLPPWYEIGTVPNMTISPCYSSKDGRAGLGRVMVTSPLLYRHPHYGTVRAWYKPRARVRLRENVGSCIWIF